MCAYKTMGPKDGEYKKYQTLNYVEPLLEGMAQETVDEYNLFAAKMLKWVKMALESRKLDIIRRKALIQKERDDRESKLAAKKERAERREAELQKAIEGFAEDHKDEIAAYEA